MLETRYLIVGSSHAGLSAAEEIRVHDPEAPLTMVTREEFLPYSPTALPYVVSGRLPADRAGLRDEDALRESGIRFLRSKALSGVDPASGIASFEDGTRIRYEKLLLATGAEPTCPRVENLSAVPFLELRTLADALRHLEVLRTAKTAVVMGTGLVGLHAAETFAERGLGVHVIRARSRPNPRILPASFDSTGAALIQGVFESHGVRFHLETHAVRAEHRGGRFAVGLSDGTELSADLLLVCTGVRPRIGFLAGSAVQTAEGVLVDRRMRTNVPGVWAAGDVAQAAGFFGGEAVLNAILTDAVLQGKVAGADMSGGRLDSEYAGGLSANTFGFFGHRAVSIGLAVPEDGTRFAVEETHLPSEGVYRRMVFDGRVLVGISAINSDFDPGILCELIRERVDLGDDFAEFVRNPVQLSRRLMWKTWR